MNTASQVEQLQPIAGKPQPLRGIGDLTRTVLFRAWDHPQMDYAARQGTTSAQELAGM